MIALYNFVSKKRADFSEKTPWPLFMLARWMFYKGQAVNGVILHNTTRKPVVLGEAVYQHVNQAMIKIEVPTKFSVTYRFPLRIHTLYLSMS